MLKLNLLKLSSYTSVAWLQALMCPHHLNFFTESWFPEWVYSAANTKWQDWCSALCRLLPTLHWSLLQCTLYDCNEWKCSALKGILLLLYHWTAPCCILLDLNWSLACWYIGTQRSLAECRRIRGMVNFSSFPLIVSNWNYSSISWF